MKRIFTNKKIGFLSLGLFLACMVSLAFLVQSCSQENELADTTDNYSKVQYLDLDVTSTTAFTKADLNTIGSALQRISAYMIFDKNSKKYVCQLKSPNEINVSERLFNYVSQGVQPYTENTMPRLKDDMEQMLICGLGYYQYSWYMTDAETVELFKEMDSMFNAVGSLSILGFAQNFFKSSPYLNLVSSLLGLAAWTQQQYWDDMRDNYNNGSDHKGATMIQTTYTGCTLCLPVNQISYTQKPAK